MSKTLVRAFPAHLARTVTPLVDSLPEPQYEAAGSITSSQSRSWPELTVAGEPVAIPHRVYNPEPSPHFVATLSDQEGVVAACIYSRHHDGFVRQRWLRRLLASDEPCAAPFIVQLLGEYVMEICEEIERFTRTELPRRPAIRRNLSAVLAENPWFAALTEQRAISYWSCYGRYQHPSRNTYPALLALRILSS